MWLVRNADSLGDQETFLFEKEDLASRMVDALNRKLKEATWYYDSEPILGEDFVLDVEEDEE